MFSLNSNDIWDQDVSSSGFSRRSNSRPVRYTWAGVFDTQLYGDQLNDLCMQTKDNLLQLADTLRDKEPCDDYGIRHWHPATRPKSNNMIQPRRSDSHGNISVMFANVDDPDLLLHCKSDETSSEISTSVVPMNFCYLCTTLEEHERNHLQRKPASMQGTKYRKPRITYIAPPPKIKKKKQDVPQELNAIYKVTIWTGDIPGASTDANVFITVTGDKGALPKTRLWHKNGTSKFCFVRGSKETFFIRSPKLGNLLYLTVEHDGLEKRHGWYVDHIEIQCMLTKHVWLFMCKNWLSMHHGDFRIKRDLEATKKKEIVREFEVTVVTGSKRLAGTDANVFITLHGTEGVSSKYHLNSHKHGTYFQRNSSDTFKIRTHDIGDIKSLRVEHDGSGLASGWFLEKVTLRDIHNPAAVWYFIYHGWLAKDIGDGLLWRELRAKKHLPKEVKTGRPMYPRKSQPGNFVQYHVTVKTGDIRYAGTDANVYIIFVGTSGKTKKLIMDDSRNNFERGALEQFKLQAFNVGNIQSILLGHDNSGPGAGWFCEEVTVRKYLSKEEIKDQVNHQKRLWEQTYDRQYNDKSSKDKAEISKDKRKQTLKDEWFESGFDKSGRLLKTPVYEEYFFPCQKWFATDEADGLIERELLVAKKTLYFQDLE
ncbi:lipoxygenase homology domain-containing protein 1-like isoform X1 [Pomacea canaliculata]|uniref:lipoxygenase homology domain-containing protein 1-like isoform X1 n=1 Tax=Pomacea canaliculata TaxID=400727 RepID=UPI000D736823|nr:lipoxygenase homology domain-containing protein 1-like isoform X1 [Pomacea canaliculata]